MSDLVKIPEHFELSEDGRRLSWRFPDVAGKGVYLGSIVWDHNPTPKELRYAIDNYKTLHETIKILGQGSSTRRLLGPIWLFHAWGPPTWWLPRPVFSLRRREIGLGWLTHGFILVWHKRKKESSK